MSAILDKSQSPKFYFGNAIVDLAHVLPQDDFIPQQNIQNGSQPELEQMLSSIENTLQLIQSQRKELSYLLSDLARIIK